MKRIIFIVAIFISIGFNAQSTNRLNSFKLQDVQLLPGIFKDAESTDLKYVMSLNPDRLLAPFLREAGLQPKAQSYTNWENTGLDGHIGGHYLTALSLLYASTGNDSVLNRLNYMLDELEKCQTSNGDGYLGGVPGSKELWKGIATGKINVGSFEINQKWVPLYNIHKTYAGLRDAYLYAGSTKAKTMLIKYCDWMINVTGNLNEAQIQNLLRSEHGGMNEVFADVAAITNNKKYLTLAYSFSDKSILEPLSRKQDKLNGMHANTQIPKVIGFKRIAEVAGDSTLYNAARFFWETVVHNRTCVIGGNSVREHFHPADNFKTMLTSEQGPETCNTYNMLKLTKQLFETEGNAKYMDFYERALYNHILSTQHPSKGGFVYFTPMRPGHYRVYSQPQTSMWCCVGSGMENHAKYGELIYSHTENELFINLFISSRLNWKDKKIVLTQNTNFPESELTSFLIETKKATKFTLQVRCPAWVAKNTIKIQVNGKPVAIQDVPGSYIAIARRWKNGDRITVQLPMQTTVEQMPDGSNYVAILHGPIVMAAKTDTTDLKGLYADDSRGGHIASGKQLPLIEMPMFAAKDKSIASLIEPIPGQMLSLNASKLIYQDKFKRLELIPFYKLHDSRYVIYWQIETPEKIQEIQKRLAIEEEARQKLANSTIDMVTCGEQQPESDHFIKTELSTTGVNKNRHWREAKAWFSYQFSDPNKQADRLQVTYFGGDKNRAFKILVNNVVVANVTLVGTKGNNFFTEEYPLSSSIVSQASKGLEVKFEANQGSIAGAIYEVRILRK